MELSPLLSLGPGLEPTSISATADGFTIHVTSTLPGSACPLCSHLAIRIHSHYTRVVADLPCAGQRVRLILQVRTFFCETPACPRKIFTERLIPFVEPRARMTCRLSQAIQTIGLATCGKLGARLAARLGIQTCLYDRPRPHHGETLAASAARGPVGGGRFLSSLVAAALAPSWWIWNGTTCLISCLTARPKRQRPGCTSGPPSSWSVGIGVATTQRPPAKAPPRPSNQPIGFTQRENLTEAVGLALVRCWTKQQQERQHAFQAEAFAEQGTPSLPNGETWRSRRSRPPDPGHLVRQAARAAEYEQIRSLQAQGLRVAEIARHLGKSRGTVRRWLAQGACASRHPSATAAQPARCLRALYPGTLESRRP